MARDRSLAGIFWSLLNIGTSVLLPLGVLVFFTRTLPPLEIGLVGLAVACVEIIKCFGLPWLYEALLQQKEDVRRHDETVLAMLLLTGLGLLLVYWLLLATLGRFIEGVEGRGVVLGLVGLRIVFDLVAIQPQVALARSLAYRKMALRSICGNILAAVAGVTVAVLGHPLAGLVVYQVGQSLLVFVITVIASGAMARPILHGDCLRLLHREAGMASGTRLIGAINNYLDQILVAALIGSLQLAYYNLGKRLEATFSTASASFNGILFQPKFAHGQPGQRGQALERALLIISVTCGIPAAIFLVNREAMVQMVFGTQWLPAATTAAILALSGYIRALNSVHGSMLSVSHRNRELMILSGISAITGMAIVLGTARLGLVVCTVSVTVKFALNLIASARLTQFELAHPLATYIHGIIMPFMITMAGTFAGNWLAEHAGAGPDVMGQALMLLASGMLGGIGGLGWIIWRYGRTLQASLRPARA